MNKILGLFFASVMTLGMVFIGDAVSSNGSLSASAQTVTVTRKRHDPVEHIAEAGMW